MVAICGSICGCTTRWRAGALVGLLTWIVVIGIGVTLTTDYIPTNDCCDLHDCVKPLGLLGGGGLSYHYNCSENPRAMYEHRNILFQCQDCEQKIRGIWLLGFIGNGFLVLFLILCAIYFVWYRCHFHQKYICHRCELVVDPTEYFCGHCKVIIVTPINHPFDFVRVKYIC
jgi:hypothetical protein